MITLTLLLLIAGLFWPKKYVYSPVLKEVYMSTGSRSKFVVFFRMKLMLSLMPAHKLDIITHRQLKRRKDLLYK